MIDLSELTDQLVFSYLIILCRIGSALMVLPGISESYVAIRIRLLFALSISVLLLPNINIPKIPHNSLSLAMTMSSEIIIGIFLGSITKLLIGTTHILGMIIATISGLGSALLFDPTQGSQGAMVGNFLTNLSIVLLFASNMHHMLILGFAESYSLFEIDKFVNFSDVNHEVIKIVSKSFDIALKLAAPQIVIAVIIMIAGGILGRLMPSIQIFNLITSPQMLISFYILMFTIAASMIWYIENIFQINKSYLFG